MDDENIKRLVRGPDFSQLELHSVRVKEGIPPGTNRDFQVTEVVVTLQRPVMLLLESEANVHWRVMVAPGADVPAVVIAGSVLRVQASGVRYTKVYQVATSDRPEISAKLSGRRASEQSFGRRALVTVDGQSRSDLHE